MSYRVKVAVCSEINIKNINTMWAECTNLNLKPVGASNNQQTLKG
jgi:hypothetical protein